MNDIKNLLEQEVEKAQEAIDDAPIQDRPNLSYILKRYSEALQPMVDLCVTKHNPGPEVPEARSKLQEILNRLRSAASEIEPLVRNVQATAGTKGRQALDTIFGLISTVVDACMRFLSKQINIISYSIGVTVGGILTFSVNYAP